MGNNAGKLTTSGVTVIQYNHFFFYNFKLYISDYYFAFSLDCLKLTVAKSY